MTCPECVYGRRFAEGSAYCRIYGMILSESHDCRLNGAVKRDGTEEEPYIRKIKEVKPEEKKEGGGTAP